MSILLFLGVLFVLVLVHELGHFAIAKWTGMRVDEFGIGFPPRLFGIRRGDTLYSFNLFPIGGFVKIFGEDSFDDSVNKEYTQGSFASKSKWAQSAVLVAGISMNILFAWFLVAIAFGIGVQTSVSEDNATENAKLTITDVLAGSPAERAGILPGTVVKSVEAGGETLDVLKPSTFSAFVATHVETPLTVVSVYKGEPNVVRLASEPGIISDNPSQHAIGIAMVQVDTVQRSFVNAVSDSFIYTITSTRDIVVGISQLLVDTVLMRADYSQIAGPVGIVGLVGETSAFGVTALLMFTAFISLNLAVINILPFPALDGGRLLFVIIEAVKGSPIAPRYVAVLNTFGFLLLISLMIVVTWNDVARLI
ncbi:MAG: site-2 protease family protein [Candidatus Pacebacteria bacterium]|nr:site-2 protease family protein [Candidatus Paceibacterota bacterium]MCF7857158.1 site-2 protease family protein [Candidatus Paceibacterota bacterium]